MGNMKNVKDRDFASMAPTLYVRIGGMFWCIACSLECKGRGFCGTWLMVYISMVCIC